MLQSKGDIKSSILKIVKFEISDSSKFRRGEIKDMKTSENFKIEKPELKDIDPIVEVPSNKIVKDMTFTSSGNCCIVADHEHDSKNKNLVLYHYFLKED